MAKHTIKGFIHQRVSKYAQPNSFTFFESRDVGASYVNVMPHTIEIDIPDDFDPRPQQIKDLQAQQQQAQADFAKLCTDIQRQISELTCLEAA